MVNPTILVTGASGQQGGAVARKLLEQGQSIRALSRSLDKLRNLQNLGVDTIVGDLNDPGTLEKALSGINKAFLVTTPFEAGMDAEVQQGINFIKAAKKFDLDHLVFNSVAAADQNTKIPHFETKIEIEKFLKSSGIPATVLRPVFFMENFASPWFLPAIQTGKLSLSVHPDISLQMTELDVIGDFVAAAFFPSVKVS